MKEQAEINDGPRGLSIPISGTRYFPAATGAVFYEVKMAGGIIYKVTNLINGKIYVGKTVGYLWARKNKHISDMKNKRYNSIFHYAINKYGINNFQWEIVDRVLFSDLLLDLEKFYIKKFNCKKPNGYNLTDGGDGVCGCYPSEETRKKKSVSGMGKICSEETRKKISISAMGNKRFLGKHHSVEAKIKMSKSQSGDKNHNFGKHFSYETKRKMSVKQHGENNSMSAKNIALRKAVNFGKGDK